MVRTSLVVCACVLLQASNVAGAPITFSFGGVVDSVGEQNLDQFPDPLVGTAFSGHYTFDSTATDEIPGDANSGNYTGTDLSLTVGGQTFAFPEVKIGVVNDFGLPPLDQYLVGFFDAFTSLSIRLEDTQGTALGSDDLPSTAPPLADFDIRFFFLQQLSDASGTLLLTDLNGRITSLTCTAGCDQQPPPVPEPHTMSLLAGALGLLAGRLRRTRTR